MEPTTKAGRLLLGKNSGLDPATVEWLLNDILAIEAEAVEQERSRVTVEEAAAEALFGTPEVQAGLADWIAEKDARIRREARTAALASLRAKVWRLGERVQRDAVLALIADADTAEGQPYAEGSRE